MPDWSHPDCEWDDANAEQLIERHDVYPEEAEQVFYNGSHVRRAAGTYYAYGEDDAGLYLFVLFLARGKQIRVITERYSTVGPESRARPDPGPRDG